MNDNSDGCEEHRWPMGEMKQLKSELPGVSEDEQIKTAIGHKKKLLEELQHQKKFANLYKVTNIVSEQGEERRELQREASASRVQKLRQDQETLRAEKLQLHSMPTQQKTHASGLEATDSEKKLLGLEMEMKELLHKNKEPKGAEIESVRAESAEMPVPYRKHRMEIAALRSEKDTLDQTVEKLNHKLKKNEKEMADMRKEIQELRQQNKVCVQLKVEVKEQTKGGVEPSPEQEPPHVSVEYSQVQRKKRAWWRRINHFITSHKQ